MFKVTVRHFEQFCGFPRYKTQHELTRHRKRNPGF